MRIAVCAKEVLDPDAVNGFALAGRLAIAEDGRTLATGGIPKILNGYDEQAIEAALRLRDAGAAFALAVVSIGQDPASLLRHAAALGADEVAQVACDPAALDAHGVAALLAAWVRASGGADLVLCGRQASDDDQGVVPALLGEALGFPVVTLARALELGAGGSVLRVVRVTPDGDETVEVALPAVVSVTSELGTPRYPTAAKKLAARRVQPARHEPQALVGSADALRPRARLVRRFVPRVEGHCERIDGTPAQMAERLIERLGAEGVLG